MRTKINWDLQLEKYGHLLDEIRRMTELRSTIPEVQALADDTPWGHCVFCQDLIRPRETQGRYAINCGAEDCERSYLRIYSMHRRRKDKKAQGRDPGIDYRRFARRETRAASSGKSQAG